MREKLTIEQFREKRKAMQELIDNAEKYYEEHSEDTNIDEYQNEIIDEFFDLQEDLFSYDLGDGRIMKSFLLKLVKLI